MEFEEIFNRVNSEKIYLTSVRSDEVKDLYELVDRYVNENYLYTGDRDEYYVSFNNRLYVIGFFYGPDILYYIRLAHKDELSNYLYFEDVLNNRISENDEDIRTRIENIKMQIRLLEDEGVSKSTIKRALKL